jgi:hypothetical protein
MGRDEWGHIYRGDMRGHASLPRVASSGPIRPGRRTAEGGCPYMGAEAKSPAQGRALPKKSRFLTGLASGSE